MSLFSDHFVHLLLPLILPFPIWAYEKFYSNNNKIKKLSFKISYIQAWPRKDSEQVKMSLKYPPTHFFYPSSTPGAPPQITSALAHPDSLKQPNRELTLRADLQHAMISFINRKSCGLLKKLVIDNQEASRIKSKITRLENGRSKVRRFITYLNPDYLSERKVTTISIRQIEYLLKNSFQSQFSDS